MLHVFSLLIIADVVWYFVFKSLYYSDNDEKQLNYYFKKINSLKSLVIITFLIEILIKLGMILFILNDYKNKFGLEDAFTVDYLDNLDGSHLDFIGGEKEDKEIK